MYCCTSAAVACNRRLASFPNFVREARVLVAVLLHDPRDAAPSGKGAPFTAATYHVAFVTSSSHKKCVARKWLVQWMATPSLCLRRGRLCSGDAAKRSVFSSCRCRRSQSIETQRWRIWPTSFETSSCRRGPSLELRRLLGEQLESSVQWQQPTRARCV